MAKWDDGYVSDVAYTNSFYRECTPIWLATASVLVGQRPPDVTRPFRYADLGCGNELTALTVAATNPHAEVWGFDFNPAHIENARTLAEQAGLTNVQFVEASFEELAALPKAGLPDFDFMVSHGVLSWISTGNRDRLFEVLGQRLRSGGLAYLSYNVTTGWSGMEPLRVLMHTLVASGPARSDLAVPEILDYLDRVKAGGAAFFPANPQADARLTGLRKSDARYIAHEFLNQDWHPMMFADVARAMSAVKCGFIGSATLSENIDAVSVPPGVLPLLHEAPDPILRETLRDLGCGQTFRRDVYRRGAQPMPVAEQAIMAQSLSIYRTGRPVGDEVTLSSPLGSMTGRPEIYRPILAMLESGPVSVSEIQAADVFLDRPFQDLLQAVVLLISSDYAHPASPTGNSPAARTAAVGLNQAIAAMNATGSDMPCIVTPAIGSALGVDLIESLLTGELLAGSSDDIDLLTTTILVTLNQCGRAVQRDGQQIIDPVEARTIVKSIVRSSLSERVPLLRQLGALPNQDHVAAGD